jgi:hypothetical protein
MLLTPPKSACTAERRSGGSENGRDTEKVRIHHLHIHSPRVIMTLYIKRKSSFTRKRDIEHEGQKKKKH